MKQTENNEIDLLLRSLAKRGESRSVSSASEAENQSSGAHLDADELNSFAEHTVPAGARARYTAHLVDCSRCRKIVAQLSAAAGLPISEGEPGKQIGTTFWQKLGSFFSPPVLRYAVPALALLAVITVGIVSLRQQRQGEFVAQNQEAVPSETAAKTQSDKIIKDQTSAPATKASPTEGQSQTSAALAADKAPKSGEKTEVARGVVTDSVSNAPAKDSPKPAAVAEPQPSFAPEPPPAAPTARPQTAATAEAKKNEELAKQKEQPAVGAVGRERDKTSNSVAAEREVNTGSRKAAAAGRGGLGIRTMDARRSEAQQSKRADEDGETRAVEGRRFRRQGNTWVDTAYDASRPAMTIVRGSEQYRVLVADEPGIRSVAEKLSGEVILVWKGRAYRIR